LSFPPAVISSIRATVSGLNIPWASGDVEKDRALRGVNVVSTAFTAACDNFHPDLLSLVDDFFF
jgi:hypothetical protein